MKNNITLIIICILALTALAACAKKNVQTTTEIDGGKVDKSYNAPKVIKSKNIESFATSFYIESRYNESDTGNYNFTIEKNDAGEFVLAEDIHYNISETIDKSVLDKLQVIIDENNLVEANGTDKHTSGLPDTYAPCMLTAIYDSGEKLYFSVDNYPEDKWAIDMVKLFKEEFISLGHVELLPPKEDTTLVRMDMSFTKGSLEYSYLSLFKQDGTIEFIRNIYNKDTQDTECDEVVPISEDFFEKLSEKANELQLEDYQNGEIEPAGTSDIEKYAFFTMEMESGLQINAYYEGEEAQELCGLLRQMSEYIDEVLTANDARVEQILSQMSIEEKIYQLFIVTPEKLTGVEEVTAAGDTTKNSIIQTPVGGIIYFSSNFTSPDQTKQMLSRTQEYSMEIEGMPLFLCVDEEGGRVTRIAQNPEFGVEKIGAMAGASSTEDAYKYGDTIGKYLANLGLNLDFAPDADVITNSSNNVIGDRSFGTDPKVVSDYAKAYSDGLHSNNIMSTYKHFPGHGATEDDTHEGYAYTNKTLEELYQSELIPFSHAGEYGVDMVMVAHISLPNVIGDDTPCSLSEKMITEVLRGEMSYDGLIVTDALNMGAISEKYSSADAAVKAFEAGNDLLLMPKDLNEAYTGLYNAYMNGIISEDRINDSVRRIIKAKMRL